MVLLWHVHVINLDPHPLLLSLSLTLSLFSRSYFWSYVSQARTGAGETFGYYMVTYPIVDCSSYYWGCWLINWVILTGRLHQNVSCSYRSYVCVILMLEHLLTSDSSCLFLFLSFPLSFSFSLSPLSPSQWLNMLIWSWLLCVRLSHFCIDQTCSQKRSKWNKTYFLFNSPLPPP